MANVRRTLLSCALICGFAFLVAGCEGTSTPSPGDVVQSYEQALAEGSYSGACGSFTPPTAAAMTRRASAKSCPSAVARCLPVNAILPKKDQSQLLYANVTASTHGSKANVTISGNPVASAIKRVSLVKRHGGWKLTSPGVGLSACRRGKNQSHRRPKRKR